MYNHTVLQARQKRLFKTQPQDLLVVQFNDLEVRKTTKFAPQFQVINYSQKAAA